MNRIIFAVTALIGLGLVTCGGSRGLRSDRFVGKTSLMPKASKREVPAKKPVSTKAPLVAIEVTDEALEELRKLSKLANTAWPGQVYKLQ